MARRRRSKFLGCKSNGAPQAKKNFGCKSNGAPRAQKNFGVEAEWSAAGEETFWGVNRMARRRRRKILVLGNVCLNGGMACGPSAAVCRPVECCAQDDTGGRTRGRSQMIWEGGRGGCPQDDTGGRTRGALPDDTGGRTRGALPDDTGGRTRTIREGGRGGCGRADAGCAPR